ncbi:MAG: tetratricopeptide repeat protein [Acidobacteriota bacterium]
MLKQITFRILLGLILATSTFANDASQPAPQTNNSLFSFFQIQESDFEVGFKAFNKGDYESAVYYYTKHIGKFPNDEVGYYNRGLAYNFQKKFQQAIADFNKTLQLNPQYWKAYSGRGYAYLMLQNYELAIREFTSAIQLNPNDNISYDNRGLCYKALGRNDLAQADFNKAAQIKSGVTTPTPKPTPTPTVTNSEEDFELGYQALQSKNYQQAIFYYNRYLSKNPNNAVGYYNRGLANDYLNNANQAITDYSMTIQINPQYTNAYINRGFVYASQNKLELALRDYSTAIQLDPNNKLAYRNRAVTYKALGQTALAEADLAKVAQLEGGAGNTNTTGGGSDKATFKYEPPKPNASGYAWKPVVEMNNQIFPSYFLATASIPIIESKNPFVIGDSFGKIGVHIINPQKNAKIKIGVSLDPIVSYQEFDATLTESGKIYLVFPKIVWNWEALKKYKKPTPANATFTLFVNGTQVDKQNVVVRIRSINEAVYAYRFVDNDKWADTGYLFAAYVNEDHEWIDKLLKEALDTRLVNSFSGYQEGPDGVLKQLAAIWFILQRRGFKYSSITDSSSTGDMVYSQYVRLFEESISVSQANCVDGTVLIASILKKIGIDVGLVLIPGHCYLVFDMNGKGDLWGLETTAIGLIDLNDYEAKDKVNASFTVLKKALEIGDKRLKESLAKIKEGDPRYNLISVNKARKDGIHPIAF